MALQFSCHWWETRRKGLLQPLSDEGFSAVLQAESKRPLVSLKIGNRQLEDLIYCFQKMTVMNSRLSQQSWTAVHLQQCNRFLGVWDTLTTAVRCSICECRRGWGQCWVLCILGHWLKVLQVLLSFGCLTGLYPTLHCHFACSSANLQELWLHLIRFPTTHIFCFSFQTEKCCACLQYLT